MGKVLYTLIICLIVTSCNNEVDLLYQQPPIPVVYCIVDPTAQLLTTTITKSVVGSQNAFDLVADKELCFYKDVNVQIFALDGDSIVETYFLQKSILSKKPGIFPQTPGYAYQAGTEEMDFDRFGNLICTGRKISNFKLHIEIPESNDTIDAALEVLKPDKALLPRREGLKMELAPPDRFYAQFYPRTDNSYYKQLNFYIHYDEKIDSVVSQKIDTIRMLSYIEDTNLDDLIEIEFGGIHFLNTIGAQFSPASDNVSWRKPKSFDFSLITIDQSFKNYIDTYENAAEGTNLVWSNVSGGIGFFAHYVSTTMRNFTFGHRTIDSLALSPRTKHLKFVRWE